jgi:NADH:ubiquinone oxidoreductase subunit K
MNTLLYWEPIIWVTPFLFNTLQSNFNFLIQVLFSGYLIFFLGMFGLIIRRISLIYTLISIELMFLGLNIVFIFLGFLFYIPFVHVIVLILLVLSAAEAAIVLSLIFLLYRYNQTIDLFILTALKYQKVFYFFFYLDSFWTKYIFIFFLCLHLQKLLRPVWLLLV